MKKITFLFLFGLALSGYAQDKQSSNECAKDTITNVSLYAAFVSNVNADLNLNQKLASQNLPLVPDYLPGFSVGFDHLGEKMSVNYMMSFLLNGSLKDVHMLLYSGLDFRLNVNYNLVKNNKVVFTAGAATAYTFNYYWLYTNGYTIDMNNLTPANNPGLITFNNGMFYLGPSGSVYLFQNKKKYKMKVTAGYEFALTRGHYHNYYGGSILNNVGESGNNRFVFGIMFLSK